MKIKIVFILAIIMTLAFFQTALGEPLKFDENLDDTIAIKRSGGTICNVPLKKGPVRGEMRPDGNINVYYRDGSRSIVVLDNYAPKRIEEYDSKNRHTKKVTLMNGRDIQSEESYGRNGKRVGLKEYTYDWNRKHVLNNSWEIDKNGDIVEKSYYYYGSGILKGKEKISIDLTVKKKDKFGNKIFERIYLDGRLDHVAYYKGGHIEYTEYANGKIYRYDKDGRLIRGSDEKYFRALFSMLRDSFASNLLALGKDKKTTKIDPTTPSPTTPSPGTPSPSMPSPSKPKPSTGNSSLVGTWEDRDEDSGGPMSGIADSYITFYENGRYKKFVVVISFSGTYSTEGNILKLYNDNGELAFRHTYRIDGNRLILDEGNNEEVYKKKN